MYIVIKMINQIFGKEQLSYSTKAKLDRKN
jgi:hypothetical protein